MNEAALDHTQTFIQLMSIALMAIPVSVYAFYWSWMTRADVPSNGR